MKTRSRLSAKDADSARTKKKKANDCQDTDELPKVQLQISEVNKLRKPLNDLVFAIKKAQISRSKKVTKASKVLVEHENIIGKIHNDTLELLKDLETHKLALTDGSTSTTPFDFVGSKAVLDDIHARYLQVRSTIENNSDSAAILNQPKLELTNQGTSKGPEPEDDSEAHNNEKIKQQTLKGHGAAKGKGSDVATSLPPKTKAPVVSRVKQNQKRVVQNASSKRGRDSESEEPTESSRKKVKPLATELDDDTLESDLSSIGESLNDEFTTKSVPRPIDGAPNPLNATPPVEEKVNDEDVEMSIEAASELPTRRPTVLPTSTILTTGNATVTVEEKTIGEDVDMLNEVVPELATQQPIMSPTSTILTLVDRPAPLPNVEEDQEVRGSNNIIAEATVLPNPGQADSDTPISAAGNGVASVATTEVATAAISVPSPEHVDLDPLADAAGNGAMNKTTTEVGVAAAPLSNSGQMDVLAVTPRNMDKEQTVGQTASMPMDNIAKVPSTAAERIVPEKTDDTVKNTIIGDVVAGSSATHAPVEKAAKRRPKVMYELGAESSDEETTDDEEDDSDITSTSDEGDDDDNESADDDDNMRLANATDIEDLKKITNKKKGKKTTSKKPTKTSPRETLRARWDNMSAKEQNQWQNKAMRQIESFLRSPSTNPVKVNTRAMIREVAELCIPACNTTRKLALHILENRYHNKFCIFHQKTDKAGRIHDDSGHGPFRVTGTPFPRVVNEKPKKMYPAQPLVECHEGYLHCGCSEDEALLEFYWWKMAEVTSPATGHTEGWLGHRKMDPRTQTMMFAFITEWTHMEVDDIFTGYPAKSGFDSRIEIFDTKIARLEAAKARAVEEEEARRTRKAARKARREAKKTRKVKKASCTDNLDTI